MLLKLSAYAKSFNKTKRMFFFVFLIKHDRFFETFDKIWDKVSMIIKKGFDSEPVYNE